MSKKDEREIEQALRIHEYNARVLAEQPPMTAEQRQQIVALLRPTARKLRELARTADDVA